MLTVGVPIRNQLSYAQKCLDALLDYTDVEWELIVVDDASASETHAYLKELLEHPEKLFDRNPFLKTFALVRNHQQLGYPACCNKVFEESNLASSYLAIVTSDVVVTPCWAPRLINHLERHRLGAIGPVTSHAATPQRLDYCAKRKLSMTRKEILEVAAAEYKKNKGHIVRIGEIAGFCFLLRREALERLRLIDGYIFDEGFGLGSGEDFDLCLRLTARQWPVAFARDVYVHHYGHRTFQEEPIDDKALWGHTTRLLQQKRERLRKLSPNEPIPPVVPVFAPTSKTAAFVPLQDQDSIDVILVRYNCPEVEEVAIQSILACTDGCDYHLIVVDNYQTGQSLTRLWNTAVKNSASELVCLVNSDIEIVDRLWLRKLVDTFKTDPTIGAVGPSTDNTIGAQAGHRYHQVAKLPPTTRDCLLSGFCWVLKRKAWLDVGGFNEQFSFYGQESEFQHRLHQRGYRTVWRVDAFVHHEGEASIRAAERRGELNVGQERSKARALYQRLTGGGGTVQRS